MSFSCSIEKKIDRETLIESAPILSPQEFIDFTYLEKGFELQLVAAEPQIIAPTAMVFDHKNRIWAVEMTGYMPDIDGQGEDSPNGKIIILEDKNKDGYYETRKVFLDSLVLPRAIALVGKGILVAEPPYLWHYDIVNDKPSNKTLIDNEYASGDNPEHQTNGLLRALDNWIYNAGGDKRYKKHKNVWIIERTQLRGQWGITQDDEGRLYYNNNSQNLLGDYFLPSLGNNNPNLQQTIGFNQRIVNDNRTYPSRPTPGVNRGYANSVLDDSLRLTSFTAACGPLIYRGNLFSEDYYQNSFVAEPAANLIKRNILNFDSITTKGKQAYQNKEFLASDDERFRPVSLYNGPDGALYIVDMYRGIIQHKLFLTNYLKSEIEDRNLDQPLNCGRIYKVVPKGTKSKMKVIPNDPKKIVQLLKSNNSWTREIAQQLLVDKGALEVVPILKQKLTKPKNIHEYRHSLWTLVGLNKISDTEIIEQILRESSPEKLIHLYTAINSIPKDVNTKNIIKKTINLCDNEKIAHYIAYRLNIFEKKDADVIMNKILLNFPESKSLAQAIISNAFQKEDELYNRINRDSSLKNTALLTELIKVQKNIIDAQNVSKDQELYKKYARGVNLYQSTCQPCHGKDGNGIEFLAPPLNNSEWVIGDKENLISIVLYGMSGPITVNKKLYKTPEISGEMPGIVNNQELVDADLALLLSYIRNNWNNQASDVHLNDIKKVKEKWKDREIPFTEKELLTQ